MKDITLLLICLLMPLLLCGQRPSLQPLPEPQAIPDLHFNTSRTAYRAAALFVSGAAEGLAETLKFHYDSFQEMHPRATPGTWNPDISWVNKYATDRHGNILQPQRPAFFGSTTFLTWTTDRYHFSRTVSRTFGAAGLSIPMWRGKDKKLKHYAAELGFSYLVWTAGFHSTYSLLYR